MSSDTKKRRSFGGILATGFFIIVAIIVGRVGGHVLGQSSANSAENSNIADGFAQAATTLRAQLPKEMGEGATMTDVQSKGSTLTYSVSLGEEWSGLDLETTKASLSEYNRSAICSVETTRISVESGGRFNWVYTDQNERSFTVSVGSCG